MCQQFQLAKLRETEIFYQLSQEFNHQVPVFLEPSEDIHGGSGTISTFGILRGILVPSHVVANCKKKLNEKFIYVGIETMKTDVNIFFKKEKISFIDILTIDDLNALGRSKWNKKALDISFILLDEYNYFQLINISNKKPIDLQEFCIQYKKDKQLYTANINNEWLGIMYGHPRKDAKYDNDKELIRLDHSVPYIGGPEFLPNKDKLKVPNKKYKGLSTDLVSIKIGPSRDYLPNDFSGASGGGLWLIVFDQNYKIVERFFGGIFVYAYNNENNKDEELYFRGPLSLYEIFCKYLEEYMDQKCSKN